MIFRFWQNLFFLVALTPAAVAAASAIIEKNNPSLSERGHKLYYEGKVFSGDSLEHWPTGAVFKEAHYKMGVAEGVTKVYALNGNLIEIANYHHGKKDGRQQGWFEEGPKRFDFYFKNGLRNGTQTEWHLNGNIFRKLVFVNGIETEKKILYPTGEIFTNYSKRNNRIYGLDGGPLCQDPLKKEGEK